MTLSRTSVITITLFAALLLWVHVRGLDGVSGLALSVLLRNDAVYAPGYSDDRFRRISLNMTENEVKEVLGLPLVQSWHYAVEPPGCTVVFFRNGYLTHFVYENGCRVKGVQSGMSESQVKSKLGTPAESRWWYSESPNKTHYRQRIIRFANGRVSGKIAGWYVD